MYVLRLSKKLQQDHQKSCVVSSQTPNRYSFVPTHIRYISSTL